MAKEKFEDRKLEGAIKVACKFDNAPTRYWETDKATVIQRIVAIVTSYRKKGYTLTLRQLHYQFVTRNWIVNHDTAYKKLGTILDDCRYAGIIDWDAIEDRGRQPYIPYSADDLADALSDLKSQYRLNRQEGQTTYVELWTEKDALSGILRRSTQKYHIQLVVNKGYTSSSAAYAAYQRIVRRIVDGIKVKVLYFGDHDPSGLDMIRDIRDRLMLFLTQGNKLNDTYSDYSEKVEEWWMDEGYDCYTLVDEGFAEQRMLDMREDFDKTEEYDRLFNGAKNAMYLKEKDLFEVVAIGLTMEQIEDHNLPSNPAKITDTRAKAYIEKFGGISWEVDALNPEVLTEIVEEHVTKYIDLDLYQGVIDKEEEDKDTLETFKQSLGGKEEDEDGEDDEDA